ncbi:MAG TPA: hypothetical protein VIS72_04750 [Anaerolineales bacterium]
MSKSLFRVAVATLIGLIVIAGVFVTVQAASANSGNIKGRADLTASDSYYSSQQRGASKGLSPYGAEKYEGGHGGCESERIDSNDY